MRDTLLWIGVLCLLYLNPPYLTYAYWLPDPFQAEQAAPSLGVQPEPPPSKARARPRVEPELKPLPPPERKIARRSGFPVVGDSIDGFNGVAVYYNGNSRNVSGRHTAPDGYNLGLKYQCVEFVKRYYYEHLNHKMPNPWGHARDFFNPALSDGQWNGDRHLYQFSNPSRSRPQANDILVFRGRGARGFGHVAIVTRVTRHRVHIIQQNAGAPGNARKSYRLDRRGGKWRVRHGRLLGWLRQEGKQPAP